jgi:hypothetical protein
MPSALGDALVKLDVPAVVRDSTVTPVVAARDPLMVQELRDLQPPAVDAAKVDAVLSLLSAETALLERWADAYDRADVRGSGASRSASA